MAVSTGSATAGTRAPDPQRLGWRSRAALFDRKFSPYAYIAPFFLLFAAFGLFPLIYTAYVSLHHVELMTADKMNWVGLDNYVNLLHDDYFWNALKNTVTLAVLSTVPQLMMSLGLAHLLNYKMRARTFYRVSMLLPYATSIAAATLVFAQLFSRDYGLINWALQHMGFHAIDWQNGRWTGQIAISIIVIWRWTGYNALIYLAGMQSIPQDLYESAAIDGASRWQQFRYVTVPSLRPTILFTVIVSSIGATQIFGEPLLFQEGAGLRGGSSRQYQTLALRMYELGWGTARGQLGRAAAMAWAIFLIIVVVVAINTFIVSGRAGRLFRRGEAGV